jgi:hypothetical protein
LEAVVISSVDGRPVSSLNCESKSAESQLAMVVPSEMLLSPTARHLAV